MNILGLDYGTKRIGVALATTPLAEPLLVVSNPTKNETEVVTEQAVQDIVKLCATHEIEKIVIGISEGRIAEKTVQFIEILRDTLPTPIEEMDETLSTHQALESMRFFKKAKKEGPRDHIAAAKILQDYLDMSEFIV